MDRLSNTQLVCQAAHGDPAAFTELVHRYEHQLAALIRYHIGDPEHAEDVLQETLLQIWQGIRQLRKPEAVGAWMRRVARNRCYDFLRSAQRHEVPIDEVALEHHADRFGRTHAQHSSTVADAIALLADAPDQERDAAHLFYSVGLSIREIAERHSCPEGTVKRRLFHARVHLRQTLGVTEERKVLSMSRPKPGAKKQPFPTHRPEITITELDQEPFGVDCRELHWWFGIPEAGNRTLWATYDLPEWKVTSVSDMQALRPARVHNLEGVEINVDEWEPDSGWSPSDWTMYGHLSDDMVQWIAVSRIDGNGVRHLRTFLDEDFDSDWGPPMPRRLEDRGRFARQPDGSLVQQHGDIDAPGAGICQVQVGERGFTCLRVYDVASEPTDQGTLMEAYLTQEGRTVLCRRYNGTRWARVGETTSPTWDEELPDANRLRIDDVTFVHWYDCLTGLALGYDAGEK